MRYARYGLVAAIAGYLIGVLVAVPVATVVFGEASTTEVHRVDLWAYAFWGGVFGGLVGLATGLLRARSVEDPPA